MGGWMESLADKVHKQGEHILNIGTFHTTTYVGMIVWNVAMLWNVLCLFVYFVSQWLYPSTHFYI